MINTFLDKIGNFFDQRYVIAYWGPVFFCLVLATGLIALLIGPTATTAIFSWWAGGDGPKQILLLVGILLSNTVLAYLLQAFTVPLVRLYEGYWSIKWIQKLAIKWQWQTWDRYARTKQIKKLQDQLDELAANPQTPEVEQQKEVLKDKLDREKKRAYDAWYNVFPHNRDELLKPTRLGNVLVAAEEYPKQLYGLDAVTWWPRLTPLLPDAFRAQIDAALTPMVAVLNLSAMLFVLTLAGGVGALSTGWRWWLCLIILMVGFLLSRMCYGAAISQAGSYGQYIRVAFDLYRHEILKQMNITVPDNFHDERLLWDGLNPVLYAYSMPWETNASQPLPQLNKPFFYDTHK